MKKIVLAALVLVLSVSCSYKQKVSTRATSFSIVPEVIKSNYATVSVSPDDDRVYYLAECLKKEMVDEFLSKKPENVLMQAVIDSTLRHYNRWKAAKYLADDYSGDLDKYVASYADVELYYAQNSHPFVLLEEDTSYYVIAFGVDAEKCIPIGDLQKILIHTLPRVPEESKLRLDFMVKDNDGTVSCYVRPTVDGKISRDPYIADFASEKEIAEYGNLVEYVKAMNEMYYQDWLSYYLKFDISRNLPHILDNWEEGQTYVVFGFPYIPNYENYIQKLTVTYHKGMYIPYSQDPKE